MIRSRRTVAAAVALAAVALVISGTVQAADVPRSPDDRANHGVGAIAAATAAVTRPDDRPAHGVGAVSLATHPPDSDVTVVVRPDDRAGQRGPGAQDPETTAVSSSVGFDWGDAGIGAAGGAGIAIVLAGAAVLLLVRRSQTAVAR